MSSSGLLGHVSSENAGESRAALVGGVDGTLGYDLAEVARHLHSPTQSYGATSASDPTMVRKSLTPITVTAGSAVNGTELILHRGTLIEGGSATKKFDVNWIKINGVGTINRVAIYEFFSFAIGTPKAAALVTATDKVTDATNTVANGDKIYFATIASNTGVLIYEMYFVINRAAGNFEVSRTLGGAKADITGADGACTYVSLGASDAAGIAAGQTLITEELVSRGVATTDTVPSPLRMDREACNRMISCRGISTAGGNSLSFFIGLHTYSA